MNTRFDYHEILGFIRDRIQDGPPPSVREIAAKFGIKSTSTVHRYLGYLEEEGLIRRQEGLNRSIILTDREEAGKNMVPILGTVTAGAPILAYEDIQGYVPFVSDRYSISELFALRVRGDSMINAGILSGDIAIVRRTPSAENGEIVVALIDDSATVKTFYKEDGHFRLQPQNPAYEPIIADEVTVLGRLIAIVRNFE